MEPQETLWQLLAKDTIRLNESKNSADNLYGNTSETNIIFIGPVGSGKSSIIAKFLDKGSQVQPTDTLEYTYARRTKSVATGPIASAAGKDLCGIWDLGGGNKLSNLLDLLITPSTVQNTSVLVVADISKPEFLFTGIESSLKMLKSRVDSVLEDLENRGSKRPQAIRANFAKRYQDKDIKGIIPIQWSLVGAKYDVYKQFQNDKKEAISALMGEFAFKYGGNLIYSSDREESAVIKLKQLISNYAFKSALGKNECTDLAKPLWINVGSPNLMNFSPSIQIESKEALELSLIPRILLDPKFSEPAVDAVCLTK